MRTRQAKCELKKPDLRKPVLIVFAVLLLDVVGGGLAYSCHHKHRTQDALLQKVKIEQARAVVEYGALEKQYQWAEWLHNKAVQEGDGLEEQLTRAEMMRLQSEMDAARPGHEASTERPGEIEPGRSPDGTE
jgi:hypothetical protein